MEDCSLRMHALETSRILWIVCHNFLGGGRSVSPTEILSPEFQRDLYLKNLSIGLFVLKKEGEQGLRGKREARSFDVVQNNHCLIMDFSVIESEGSMVNSSP